MLETENRVTIQYKKISTAFQKCHKGISKMAWTPGKQADSQLLYNTTRRGMSVEMTLYPVDVFWWGGVFLYFEWVLITLNILSEEKECCLRHISKENCIKGVQSVLEAWFSLHSDFYCCQCNLHPVNTKLENEDFLHYHGLVNRLLLNVLSASVASRTVCSLRCNSNFSLFSWIYDYKK